MALERAKDRDELGALLADDPLTNAYLLGNLDPAYFEFGRWFVQRNDDGAIENLVLHYTGLSMPVAFFVVRNPATADRFFRAAKEVLPRRFHFHVLGEHLGPFRQVFPTRHWTRTLRMGLRRGDVDLAALTPPDIVVESLGHRDTAAIMALYEHYPDHFFDAYQLETGLYFGVRDPRLGLVSIAGVHSVSHEFSVGVVGNFVTHSSVRGQGLGTACTARLLDEMFSKVSLAALNVSADNEPAINLYTKFGFQTHSVFFEGRLEG